MKAWVLLATRRSRRGILGPGMDPVEIDLRRLLEHPSINTEEFIAPVIFRLARTQKARAQGERGFQVRLRRTAGGAQEDVSVTICWSIRELDDALGYNRLREELRKLRDSKSPNDITELAACCVAFLLVGELLPEEKIVRIVLPGGRGDYYLNWKDDEMVEVSGTVEGNLDARFAEKTRQILKNKGLRRAFVSVTSFSEATSILERVK